MTKFDPEKAPILESADRLIWNNPAQIVNAVEIRPGERVAEIGCGSGWFTFEIERACRPRGMVYALDMQPAMLQILRARCENWERILTLPCGENSFELDDAEVDVVFHANVLHECEEPLRHLAETRRVLKNDGRLIVIEWHPGAAGGDPDLPGPSAQRRLESETVRGWVEEAGFVVQETRDVGPYHYAVIALKS